MRNKIIAAAAAVALGLAMTTNAMAFSHGGAHLGGAHFASGAHFGGARFGGLHGLAGRGWHGGWGRGRYAGGYGGYGGPFYGGLGVLGLGLGLDLGLGGYCPPYYDPYDYPACYGYSW